MLKFACVKYTSLITPPFGKHLNAYTYEDVNALYAMVSANCTESFEFYCFVIVENCLCWSMDQQ